MIYEYGAMSSKYSLETENELTAYATMVCHFQNNAHIMVIYVPENAKSWTSFDGKISERLDEIFGGEGAFDAYIKDNIEDVRACYNSIKKLV